MTADAACLGAPLSLLFPTVLVEDAKTGEVVEEDVIDAPTPEFCFTCPKRLPCLHAGWHEKFGIWGGMNYADRLTAHLQGKGPEDCFTP